MNPVDSIETNTSPEAVHETRAFRPPLRSQLVVAGTLVGALLVAGCGSREAEGSSPTIQSSPTESTGSASTSPSVPSSPMPTNKPGSPESTPTPTPTTPPSSEEAPIPTQSTSTNPDTNLAAIEGIESLAPTLEDHKNLPLNARVRYNYVWYKRMLESGDMSTYLSWTLYKEKTADGNLVDDENTSVINYNPADANAEQTPDSTCEQIRQEYIFKQAVLSAMTADPGKFYDEANLQPLDKTRTERLIDGMYVQPFDGSRAAAHYDAAVYNYTTAFPNAKPNPYLKRLECVNTKDIKAKKTSIKVGSQVVETYLKEVTFKLKDSGTVYDAAFAYFDQPDIKPVDYYDGAFSIDLSKGGTWLIDSFDKRS